MEQPVERHRRHPAEPAHAESALVDHAAIIRRHLDDARHLSGLDRAMQYLVDLDAKVAHRALDLLVSRFWQSEFSRLARVGNFRHDHDAGVLTLMMQTLGITTVSASVLRQLPPGK